MGIEDVVPACRERFRRCVECCRGVSRVDFTALVGSSVGMRMLAEASLLCLDPDKARSRSLPLAFMAINGRLAGAPACVKLRTSSGGIRYRA